MCKSSKEVDFLDITYQERDCILIAMKALQNHGNGKVTRATEMGAEIRKCRVRGLTDRKFLVFRFLTYRYTNMNFC